MFDRLAAIALPALLFIALAATHAQPPDRHPRFPTVDTACGQAELVLPTSCRVVEPQPCASCTLNTCLMTGDWAIQVRAEGLVDACTYELRVRDKGHWADDVAHWLRGGREVPCTRDGDGLDCRLALDPVRLVSIGLVGKTPEGRVVSSAWARVIVGRDGGLDIRDQAIVPTLVIALVAIALALAILSLGRRLRWPDEGGALDRRRALLTASGAGASMVLATFLPADVGGFDARDPTRLLWLVPIGMLIGLVLGPVVARARATYAVRSTSQRVVLAVGACVAVLAFSLFYRIALSEVATIETRVTVKYLFYATLGVAFFLPSLIHPASGPHRAARLLGATVIGAFLLGAVAIATGHAWEPMTHQGLLGGFYKPPSAFTMTLVDLPFLAALVIAASVGRERPAWLDGLMASLDAALDPPSPDDRMASVRELARGLARRVDDVARLSATAAAPLSYFAPLMIAPLVRDRHERAQLGLRADEAPALERALSVLIENRRAMRFHELGLTLPGDARARARVHAIPWARPNAERQVVVLRRGTLDDDHEVRRRLVALAPGLPSSFGLDRLDRGGYVVVDIEDRVKVEPGGPEERLMIDRLPLSASHDSRKLAP